MRELYGLKDPRLPSPYAQDLAVAEPAGQLAMLLGSAAAAAAGAAWQIGPAAAIATYGTYLGKGMADDAAREVRAAEREATRDAQLAKKWC